MSSNYILGIDLGTASIGWSMIALRNGKPAGLLDHGVRRFEEGLVDRRKDGKGKGPGKARREKRSQRRVIDRRARRLSLLFSRLQQIGLLPPSDSDTSPYSGSEIRPANARERHELRQSQARERHRIISALDNHLIDKYQALPQFSSMKRSKIHQRLPYFLRSRALEERLEPYKLGRALYHVAHRRGFKSNRKTPLSHDERKQSRKQAGKTKTVDILQEMKDLQCEIDESGKQTLGAYLASLDPNQQRLRNRYTTRAMYVHEFNLIMRKQQEFCPDILDRKKERRIYNTIFKQRPLKTPRQGYCALEGRGYRRASRALIESQRFRALQRINDLQIISKENEPTSLNTGQRNILLDASEDPGVLTKDGVLTVSKAKNLLNLPRSSTLNFDELPVNTTVVRFKKVLGELWDRFDTTQQNDLVEEWLTIGKDAALARRLRKHWGMDRDMAMRVASLHLEEGHLHFSRKAIRKLMPLLNEGISLATAIKEIYPGHSREVYPSLPPVLDIVPEITNPMVLRSLSELRKVINSIIREYGKPDTIRIEMARDLKRNAKQRQKLHLDNKKRKKVRDEIRSGGLKDEDGLNLLDFIRNPKESDILKVRLALETNWHCVYSGNHMSMQSLFGEAPKYEIEHIIPRSLLNDDSFLNKTLCHHSLNRAKSKRTPRQAFGDSTDWEQMQAAAKQCFGAKSAKYLRFVADDEDLKKIISEFESRQLNDTAYTSKLAQQYLGCLYPEFDGARWHGRKRIQVSSGPITGYLRNVWGLNSILGDGGKKSRTDHRHHTVDAFCIALTDHRIVEMLNRAAAASERNRNLANSSQRKKYRRFDRREIQAPWPGFDFEVYSLQVREIVVSHQRHRKLTGELHADNSITFDAPKSAKHVMISNDVHRRRVATKSNHHLAIHEVIQQNGKVKWEGRVVSLLEASRRYLSNPSAPIIDTSSGFLFHLRRGDICELKTNEDDTDFFIVRGISQKSGDDGTILLDELNLVPHSEARRKEDINDPKIFLRIKSAEGLRKKWVRKVRFDYLGREEV